MLVSKVHRGLLEALLQAPLQIAGRMGDTPCPSLPPYPSPVSPQLVHPGHPTSGNSWDTLPSGGSLAPKPSAGNILSLS